MSEETSPTRRCSTCALNFPDAIKWRTCARCGERTDYIGNAAPNLTDEEATSILRHREFAEYEEKEEK